MQPSPDATDVPPIRIEDVLSAGEADPPRGVREGLPPAFRMRADAHYVEQLDSPPSTSETKSSAAAARSIAPAAVDPGADASSELERSLSALGVCAHLLDDSAPALARMAAANLIRAEVCRALCLLQASRVLRDDAVIRRVPVSVRALIDRVLQSVEPERRLRNVVVDRQVDVSVCRVSADEELLASALCGVLLVSFGLLDGFAEPRVTVTARANGEFTFTVAHEGCRLPVAWMTDTGDGATADRAGDGGAVLLLAARRIIERCGGGLGATTARRGSEIRVSIPRLQE
jgi:nitrogen-specific signal transduction histidine kinase